MEARRGKCVTLRHCVTLRRVDAHEFTICAVTDNWNYQTQTCAMERITDDA